MDAQNKHDEVAGTVGSQSAEDVPAASGMLDGEPVQRIENKFPEDIQDGKTFNYTIEDGKVHVENGISEADFVVDADGNLHIGRGHCYLANGEAVQAAGTMKVNSQGYVRLITNESGHYQPTIQNAQYYPQVLNNLDINIQNTWIRISDFTSSLSNYVVERSTYYDGPIMYIR